MGEFNLKSGAKKGKGLDYKALCKGKDDSFKNLKFYILKAATIIYCLRAHTFNCSAFWRV